MTELALVAILPAMILFIVVALKTERLKRGNGPSGTGLTDRLACKWHQWIVRLEQPKQASPQSFTSITANDKGGDTVKPVEIERLRSAIGSRRVTPSLPRGMVADVRADSLDEQPATVERDASSGWSCFLIYGDADGDKTKRRVTCRKISGDGRPVYFSGYCHERRAPRTFRIDRIIELIDYETGELVDPVRHFEDLRMHGLLPMRDRSLADLALTMVFMAKCDGEFHPLEHDAIEQGLSRYLVRCGGSEQEIAAVLKAIPALAPDGDDVCDAVKRLLQSESCGSIARLIMDCSTNVMLADGKYQHEETLWSNELMILLADAAN